MGPLIIFSTLLPGEDFSDFNTAEIDCVSSAEGGIWNQDVENNISRNFLVLEMSLPALQSKPENANNPSR